MWKTKWLRSETVIFQHYPFTRRVSILDICVNTTALFHVLESSGKYEFTDTHMWCGEGLTVGRFHLVIIYSFLCLWHLSRVETSLTM